MNDKETIVFSNITPIVRLLVSKEENFHLNVIGNVETFGFNEDCYKIHDYDIRMLIYKGGVVLEQIKRSSCDSIADVVVSHSFNFDEVPEFWHLEVYSVYDDNHLCEEKQKHVDLGKYKKFIKEFVK